MGKIDGNSPVRLQKKTGLYAGDLKEREMGKIKVEV